MNIKIRYKKFLLLGSAVIISILGPSFPSLAQKCDTVDLPSGGYQATCKVTNNTGQAINDFHVSISGTGGSITNPMLIDPMDGTIVTQQGVPPDQRPPNPWKLPTDISIDFTNHIADQGMFTFKFDVDFPDIFLEGRVFTKDKKPIGEKHPTETPKENKEFKVDPDTPSIPPTLEERIEELIQEIFGDSQGVNFILPTTDNTLEITTALIDLPSVISNPELFATGFTEIHLVYREDMGVFSGIDIGNLNQGGYTYFQLDPNIFNDFGEFNSWNLSYSLFNPTTEQHIILQDDQKVPEPSAIIGLLAVGGLGIASKLKKKSS